MLFIELCVLAPLRVIPQSHVERRLEGKGKVAPLLN